MESLNDIITFGRDIWEFKQIKKFVWNRMGGKFQSSPTVKNDDIL